MKNEEGIGPDRIICPVAAIDEPLVSGSFSARDLEDIATAKAEHGVPTIKIQALPKRQRTTLGERLREHRQPVSCFQCHPS